MSINATSNYMTNTDILAWMEEKTEGLYGKMRDSMDVANTRADAESALDDIKAAIANTKTNGGDAGKARELINDALDKYKDVPEVAQVLQPMADKLNGEFEKSKQDARNAQAQLLHLGPVMGNGWLFSGLVNGLKAASVPKPITLSSDESDAWTKQIGDKVDALGKQDQLGLINIQEFNSQLNQAKQTASALMDSADKTTNSIINHIS